MNLHYLWWPSCRTLYDNFQEEVCPVIKQPTGFTSLFHPLRTGCCPRSWFLLMRMRQDRRVQWRALKSSS
eukprot:symbB.v1.2.000319.t2/scaffold6.1/size569917/22